MQINKKIEFTIEELEILELYLFKKLCKLEDAKLTDSKCYIILQKIRNKIIKKEKEL